MSTRTKLYYSVLMSNAREQARSLADKVSTKAITPSQFEQGMLEAMHEWHARANFIGRQAAGDPRPLSKIDDVAADEIMAEQRPYLASFVQEIQRGNYGITPDELKNRALMYPERTAGTANRAWVHTLDPDTMIRWNLSHAEHCLSCISLAKHSPYRAGDLHEYPADGGTECIVHCKCFLSTSDGRTGIMKPGTVPVDGRGWPVR